MPVYLPLIFTNEFWFAFQVSTVDEDDDGMWQHVYGGEDEGTTEEEMTSSANRRPEAGSESEAGGCGLEEEAIHDRTMTVASPVHRLQAVSEPVLSVVDYTDDILQHAKSREVNPLLSTSFSAGIGDPGIFLLM